MRSVCESLTPEPRPGDWEPRIRNADALTRRKSSRRTQRAPRRQVSRSQVEQKRHLMIAGAGQVKLGDEHRSGSCTDLMTSCIV
jgi:hypothetical protein